MAIPWLPIAIGASSLIAGGSSLINANAQRKINERNQRFQERMFNETNKYNDPAAQMQRLEQAGLNPNMVYGQSSGGAAGTASQPTAPDLKAPDYTAAGAALGGGIEQIVNTRATQSATSVNEARTENIRQDSVNKGLDAVTKAINNAGGALDYKTKKRLYDTTIQTAETKLKNLGISGEYTSNKDAREQQITNATLGKIEQEVNNLRKQGKNLSEENIMRAIDRQLYEDYKIRPQDPIYMRAAAQIMNYFRSNFKF